jgi:hypothetical protein
MKLLEAELKAHLFEQVAALVSHAQAWACTVDWPGHVPVSPRTD